MPVARCPSPVSVSWHPAGQDEDGNGWQGLCAMGFEGGVWRLVRREELVGEIVVEETEAGSAGPPTGSDVDVDLDLPVMTWERFWQLIEVLGGEAGTETCEQVETACARLTEVLAREPLGQIIGFGERLAEALHRLDQEQFGTLPITGAVLPDGSPFPQSSDHFLYARAAVVVAGRDVYESVFHDPERFAPFTARQCEPLLYVHEEAFELVTGTEWDRLTRYDYESCSNADGWPELRG
ncbi:DUF4240 domain-containing protein [Kitasatospora sp. NPDC094016]|uniref:DUF4240 domain-containing protein n=1 Tax=Kitasatospora sp. NPDC094016 TaxID=3154986 RepID=UPI00332198B4